jgi:putative methyltransferase (TIGR04325 family)
MKQKIIETTFSSKGSSFFSPWIRFLISLGLLNVWEGIYPSWEEAPEDGNVHEGDIWVNKITDSAQKSLADYRSRETVSLASLTKDYILSVASGMLLPSAENDLCIIDFGGGMGASYLPLIASIPHPEKVEFHIVEGKTICERGQKILEEFSKLHFHTQFPKLIKPVDIVHAGSSIQYVKDWKALLTKFTDYQPRLLVLEDLMAGDIPSFITTQNYYGKRIRSWFFNINELIEEIEARGYTLTYKSRYTREILGKFAPLKMKNFPKKYRLNYGTHLMFERK